MCCIASCSWGITTQTHYFAHWFSCLCGQGASERTLQRRCGCSSSGKWEEGGRIEPLALLACPEHVFLLPQVTVFCSLFHVVGWSDFCASRRIWPCTSLLCGSLIDIGFGFSSGKSGRLPWAQNHFSWSYGEIHPISSLLNYRSQYQYLENAYLGKSLVFVAIFETSPGPSVKRLDSSVPQLYHC